jgi:hypothetical protein
VQEGREEGESVAMRQLRAEVRRLQQEHDILKKALASNCLTRSIMPPTS